jgi:hypothetical protein
MKQRKKGERVLISFDYATKRLLRNKANYEVLEGFLSELLLKDVSVKSIGESESNREGEEDRQSRADILVEDASGEILLIELQFRQQIDFLQRMLFGTSKAVTERIHKGDDYLKVRKVYSINIVYFDLGQGNDYVYHGKTRFTGLHKKDELLLSGAQRKVFGGETAGDVYPEYYILKINNFNDVAKDTLDEWIYFFKHNIIKDEFTAKGLDRAREALDRDNLTPEEQKYYDYIQHVRSDNRSYFASSKAEGREEGIIEGMEKGRIEREKLAAELEKERKEREERERELEKERKEREEREGERERERAALLAEIARLRQNEK